MEDREIGTILGMDILVDEKLKENQWRMKLNDPNIREICKINTEGRILCQCPECSKKFTENDYISKQIVREAIEKIAKEREYEPEIQEMKRDLLKELELN